MSSEVCKRHTNPFEKSGEMYVVSLSPAVSKTTLGDRLDQGPHRVGDECTPRCEENTGPRLRRKAVGVATIELDLEETEICVRLPRSRKQGILLEFV